MLVSPSAAARASSRRIWDSSRSIAVTRPGATARASPTVIEPGPQPRSSRRMPGRRCPMMAPAWVPADLRSMNALTCGDHPGV